MVGQEYEWAYFAPGIRWLLRPATPGLADRVAKRVAALTEEVLRLDFSRLHELDLPGEYVEGFAKLLGKPGSAEVVLGFGRKAAAVWFADELVDAWEGIEGEDGQPSPVSASAIRRCFMLPTRHNGRDVLLEPFLCWIWPARAAMADDCERLRTLAAAHTAKLAFADDTRVPDLSGLATLTAESAFAAAMERRSWHLAPPEGALIGVDYARCIELCPAICASDGGGFVRCLRAIEEGVLQRQEGRSR